MTTAVIPRRNRPTDNTVAENVIEGRVPDGLDRFSMAGILVHGADRTVVTRNRVRLPGNPKSRGAGEGILLTARTASVDTAAPGPRESAVEENQVGAAGIGVLVENAGVAADEGLVLRDNEGLVIVQDPPAGS